MDSVYKRNRNLGNAAEFEDLNDYGMNSMTFLLDIIRGKGMIKITLFT